MDNSSLFGTSISEGNHNSVDKLSTGLSSKLQINDENQTNNTNDVQKIPSEGYNTEEVDDYSDEGEKEDEDEDFSEEELLAQMGYTESTTKREEPNKSQARRLLEESILAQLFSLKKEPPKHEPITTPTPELNLVSAFKGSRKKDGTLARELRVSWAPDVYDPPPNLYDPPPISKGVAGKNWQKGGGKKAGASEGAKDGVGKGKTAGKNKVKKQGKKGGGGSASKYSELGEF